MLPFLPRPIISIFPLPQSLAPHNAALARSHGAELSAGVALPVPRMDAGSEGSRIPTASVAGWTLGCSVGEPVCPLLPAFPPALGQPLTPQRWAGVWGDTPRRAASPRRVRCHRGSNPRAALPASVSPFAAGVRWDSLSLAPQGCCSPTTPGLGCARVWVQPWHAEKQPIQHWRRSRFYTAQQSAWRK